MSTPKNDLYVLREFDLDLDKNFILATWLRNAYYGSPVFSEIPKDIFMGNYHRVLERLFQDETVTIKIACLKEDSEVILGYAVYRTTGEAAVLDYIFVKQAWRKIGIGKSLMPENVTAVTHVTKQGLSMLKTKLPGAVYNPFLI